MKALRSKPKYKVYFRYQNIKLWKNLTLQKLHKKKWLGLKSVETQTLNFKTKGFRNIRPIYLCHSRKLNVERLYFYKFLNKQILRHYFLNYTELTFRKTLQSNYLKFECRLDFNLYKAGFVTSLYEAHFLITHGFVLVNNKIITNINYILHTNDFVLIDSKIWLKIKKTTLKKLAYIRNLEVDYTIGSFIFFNLKNFFILNFNNFIKEIYINSNTKKINSNYQTNVFTNNYFIFFESIFNNYLFLNKSAYSLTKHKLITNTTVDYLLKYLRVYFNDYFFRNILLKRIFQFKFNYLNSLPLNLTTVQVLNKISNSTFNKNLTLNNEFFKYYSNLIVKFYVFMLKNYFVTQLNFHFENSTLNNYTFKIFLVSDLFKLLHIKHKVFYFFKNNNFTTNSSIGYSNKTGINKYKLIDMSSIRQQKTSKTRYLQYFQVISLSNYVSSNIFKYKLYTKCKSFYQNNKRRYNCLKKIRRAFLFKYYNKLRFGINPYIFTKNQMHTFCTHVTYNKVVNSNDIILNKNSNIYYPVTTKLYNLIYTSSIVNTNNLIKELAQLIKDLRYFILQKPINEKQLNLLLDQLNNKIKFFETTKIYKNFNCNTFYKNIYLLTNLIKNQNKSSNNFNLQFNDYNTLYKVHLCNNYLNSKFTERYSTKRLHHFLAYYSQRIRLNYYYINMMKSKKLLASNIKFYFNKNITKQNFNFLINFNRFRKGRSKYFYKYDFNHTKCNIFKMNSKTFINFNLNMNLIDTNLKFNDVLFLIDLILNVSTRSLNSNYNLINTKTLTKFKNNSVVNIVTKKDLINFYNYKKNQKLTFYKFNNYTLHFFTNKLNKKIYLMYNSKSLKNKVLYYYNFNNYNKQYMLKLYKLYFLNYNLKKNKKIKLLCSNFKQQDQILNILKIYTYYMCNIKKYRLLKYIFQNYIFKEYEIFINKLLTFKNIKQVQILYIKKLYYNLLFAKFYNYDFYDFILKQNFTYSRNFRIMINYFILIKRFYH